VGEREDNTNVGYPGPIGGSGHLGGTPASGRLAISGTETAGLALNALAQILLARLPGVRPPVSGHSDSKRVLPRRPCGNTLGVSRDFAGRRKCAIAQIRSLSAVIPEGPNQTFGYKVDE
jgi:hypothetical protein